LFSRTNKGHSLAELVVASGLLFAMVAGVALVFQASIHYYRRSSAQVEIEQRALTSLRHLSRELSEAAATSLVVGNEGVVFASPRDSAGKIRNDSDGRPLWHAMVCYQRSPSAGTDCLLRQESVLPTPVTEPPNPLDFSPVRDVEWFRTSSGLAGRVIARDVDAFEVVRETLNSGLTRSEVLLVELTAGSRDHGERNIFSVKLQTRVFPRN